jgi:hypothetical protein
MARNYVDFVTKQYMIAGLAEGKRYRGTVPQRWRPKAMIKASTLSWLAGLLAVWPQFGEPARLRVFKKGLTGAA